MGYFIRMGRSSFFKSRYILRADTLPADKINMEIRLKHALG